uniref:histidine kinase n=1 Tax=Chromera velia CCMP2878 TaxID=1169474 RepID=A0A0G4HSH8_9ALVE|eukprot:Cvel_8269.t1-p1 / transcript=Cvel_8269.t1 / gene=Cvel_8269 / organism=Chromera_velia_CCMP2878 / gene_product=hypothetical protein / transcript_product=hypothetical protein / location=Cvel_scaffold453:28447-39077(-) / protein_length=1194 / sequence_SO=supercontig / SO=protein_coding / is_pseudo=false
MEVRRLTASGPKSRNFGGIAAGEGFRIHSFEKQRKYMSATIFPIGVFMWFCLVAVVLTGVSKLTEALHMAAAVAALLLSVSPELVCGSNPNTIHAREGLTLLCMWTMIVLSHVSFASWESPSMLIRAYGFGSKALLQKLFLVVLHFSDFQFWFLNLTDTVLFLSQGFVEASVWVRGAENEPQNLSEFYSIFMVGGALHTFLTWGGRKVVMLTLAGAHEEVELRRNAEAMKDKFLSYIMHEMRNPLSGASLLAVEFQETLKDLLEHAGEEEGLPLDELRCSVQTMAYRLQQQTEFLIAQFTKMKGVCDDVLQLEKLEKGGFQYAFRPVNIRLWITRLSRQAAPLFNTPKRRRSSALGLSASGGGDAGVSFSWDFCVEEGDAEKLFQERPIGVADFLRLDQVVSNFLSNARKFTKKGAVKLICSIRTPSKTELDTAPFISAASHSASPAFPSSPEKTQRKQWNAAAYLAAGREGDSDLPSPSASDVEADTDSLKWVVMQISVKDTGPGLSQEDVSKLFKPYGQVRAGDLQNGGGTGLGLVICKSFVEAHAGGVIGVESRGRGEGSTFFFSIFLPLLEPPPTTDQIQSPTETEMTLTEKQKGEPGSSRHSQQEKKSTEKVQKGRRREVGDQSRKKDETVGSNSHYHSPTSPLPAFLNTPLAASYTLRMCACGRLIDPATPGSSRKMSTPASLGRTLRESRGAITPSSCYLKELAEASGRASGRAADREKTFLTPASFPAVTSPASTCIPVTTDVLLVDDDRFCLMAGAAAIRRLGFSVTTAEDGDEAVALFVKKKSNFHLVLIDKNMERMGGLEAVRKIKEHFDTAVETPMVEGVQWAVFEEDQRAQEKKEAPEKKKSPSSTPSSPFKGTSISERSPLLCYLWAGPPHRIQAFGCFLNWLQSFTLARRFAGGASLTESGFRLPCRSDRSRGDDVLDSCLLSDGFVLLGATVWYGAADDRGCSDGSFGWWDEGAGWRRSARVKVYCACLVTLCTWAYVGSGLYSASFVLGEDGGRERSSMHALSCLGRRGTGQRMEGRAFSFSSGRRSSPGSACFCSSALMRLLFARQASSPGWGLRTMSSHFLRSACRSSKEVYVSLSIWMRMRTSSRPSVKAANASASSPPVETEEGVPEGAGNEAVSVERGQLHTCARFSSATFKSGAGFFDRLLVVGVLAVVSVGRAQQRVLPGVFEDLSPGQV